MPIQGSYVLIFACPEAQQVYTLSIADASGNYSHSSITVTNSGYRG